MPLFDELPRFGDSQLKFPFLVLRFSWEKDCILTEKHENPTSYDQEFVKSLGYNVDQFILSEQKQLRQIQTCFTDVMCTPSTGEEGNLHTVKTLITVAALIDF